MGSSRYALSLKFLALLVLPAIVSLAGFAITSAVHRRHEIESEVNADLEDYIEVFSRTLPALATRLEPAALIEIVERMAQHQHVHGIAVYDRSCHVLARSRQFERIAAEVDRIACSASRVHHEIRTVVREGDADVLVHPEVIEGTPTVGVIAVGYELNEMRESLRDMRMRLAYASILLLVVMTAVATIIARRLGWSLGDLLAGANKVAGGDLSVRLAERGVFGTGQVAAGFNRMAEALATAQSKLDSAEEQRRDLERRIVHAQTLAAVGQVAASLAHDIGSPLSTILLAARMHAEDTSLPESARLQFELIAAQCDRVTRTVKQLLAVSRPARERRERVDLASVVNEVIAFVQPAARQRRIHVRADLPALPVTVRAQRDTVLQMLVNLAINALQAQPKGKGGVVVIALRCVGPDAVIEVRDAGPGIPPELRARVFEPFFSTKAPGEGTGLGMSIAAGVAKDLDGSIVVDDAPEGGACIRVTVPVAQAGDEE